MLAVMLNHHNNYSEPAEKQIWTTGAYCMQRRRNGKLLLCYMYTNYTTM